MPKSKNIKCELRDLHSLFGKKWSYSLLYNIDQNPISYNKLDYISKREINPTLLSNRLKDFIRFNLIKREIINNKVVYSITEKGDRLKSFFNQIRELALELGCHIPQECKNKDCSGCQEFNKIKKW